FAHRVYGKHPTTRTLYEKYKDVYEGVAYFDSKADDKYKAQVLKSFQNGDIKIVFAPLPLEWELIYRILESL
ncbi:MAG: hypothetical protein ACFNVI_09860, partial [Lachnoanaerobaculum gingivalis]